MKTRDLALGESEFRRQRKRGGRNRDDRGREPEHDTFDDEALRQRQSAGAERTGRSAISWPARSVRSRKRLTTFVVAMRRMTATSTPRRTSCARTGAMVADLSDSTETRARLRCSSSGVIFGKRVEREGTSVFSSACAWLMVTPSRRASNDGEASRRNLLVLEIQRRRIPDIDRRVTGSRTSAGRTPIDDARAVIDLDATSDDRRIGAIASLPKILRDEDREKLVASPTHDVSLRSKSPPMSGPHTEEIERARRHQGNGHAFWRVTVGEREGVVGGVGTEIGKGAALCAKWTKVAAECRSPESGNAVGM